MVTVDPADGVSPARGLWSMTVPAGSVVSACSDHPGLEAGVADRGLGLGLLLADDVGHLLAPVGEVDDDRGALGDRRALGRARCGSPCPCPRRTPPP